MTAPEPMSERDALIALLKEHRYEHDAHGVAKYRLSEDIADALLRAGFTRPVAATGVTEEMVDAACQAYGAAPGGSFHEDMRRAIEAALKAAAGREAP